MSGFIRDKPRGGGQSRDAGAARPVTSEQGYRTVVISAAGDRAACVVLLQAVRPALED